MLGIRQEHGLDLDRSPLKSFRAKPGVGVALGKWFTPGIGLRTKFQGVWGKRVGDVNTKAYDIDNKYWLLQEQIMFNLSNMICGYNESRVWNIIPFIGGGVGRSMSRNFYGMGLSAGVQSSWRLSKALRVYLEAGWNRFEARC